jgi:hypothetical protein
MKHPLIVTITACALVIAIGSLAPTASGSTHQATQPKNRSAPIARRQTTEHQIYLPVIMTPSLITNVRPGDEVAQTITLIGTYPVTLTADLWVFVVPPGGRYYPQSMNACNRERTPKVNGKWEMRVGFGGPDNVAQPFRIVLTAADTQASQLIVDTLHTWCQAGNYPGFEQLPPGVTPIEAITVIRSADPADRWGPAPAISNIELPGEVTITSLANGAQVPQWLTLLGAYTPAATYDIWVLVYPTNGRWYPQSTNACAGVHTQKSGGRWQVPAGFGGAGNVGEPFDIVVVLANATASMFFDAKQKEWCLANNYPGWLTIELPQGIAEKARIRVYRT